MELTGEPDFEYPNGHCVRLVFVSVTGKELCEEIEWFYGNTSLEAAEEHRDRCLDPENMHDMTEGTYKLTIHEAFMDKKRDRHDYADGPIERIVFRIKRPVLVEVVER